MKFPKIFKKIGNTDEDKYGRKCMNCGHYMTSHHAKNHANYRFGKENVGKWKRLNCRECNCEKYR